jgi:hypothetical protein
MAISMGALDTHIVLCGLHEYREAMMVQAERMSDLLVDHPNAEISGLGYVGDLLKNLEARIESTERLIKSFTRSYAALERLGRW